MGKGAEGDSRGQDHAWEHRTEPGEGCRRSRSGHGTKVGVRTGVGVLAFIIV